MCPTGPCVAKPKPRILVLRSYLWPRLQFHWDVPRCGLVVLSGPVRLVSTWGRCLGCGTSAPPTAVPRCCLRAAHLPFRPEGSSAVSALFRPLDIPLVFSSFVALPESELLCPFLGCVV